MSDSFQTKPFLFQNEQVNCTCFFNSPKDKQKIFLSKNQSLKERPQHQSLIKQQKGIPSLRNQSDTSKNKKKSLKKQKSSNISETSRKFHQQTQSRSYRNQQKEKQVQSATNIQSRRHSQSLREHHRKLSSNNQFNQHRIQNYKNIHNLNEHIDLKLNSNFNHLDIKQQKSTRHIRQLQHNQINPFHQLQQFHLMGLNNHKQGTFLTAFLQKSQQKKTRQKTQSTPIQWKTEHNVKNAEFNNQGLIFLPASSPIIYLQNTQTDKKQNLYSQRNGYKIDTSTKAQFQQVSFQQHKKHQHSIQREFVSIDRNKDNLQNQKRLLSKNNQKNSTRKQSINSMNRQHHYHQKQKQKAAQNHNNFGTHEQQTAHFQKTHQVNPSQLSNSPVRTLNSFRGSKFSYKQKQSISKKLNEIRMIPKQTESFDDENQDNRSQISDVVARGWNNEDNDNQNHLDYESYQARKNRIQFKTLTLFTRESQLNSKTNTKASQIKTGTQHSLFLSPKSQQITKMYQFPLNQKGKCAYDLSYKNIENLSQFKNRQNLMNKHFQGQKKIQKSVQKQQNSASKNKKERKSSLKYI